HRDPLVGRCRVGCSVWGLAGAGNGDGGEYRLAHGFGEPWVAVLGWGGGESEGDAGAGCVEQVCGVRNVDAESPGLGDAGDEGLQERNALLYHWSVCVDGRGAVQEREHVGVGQADCDMEIPRLPQVLDWVVRQWTGRLRSSVGGERLASDRFEQSLHVTEVAVDRGRLHSGGGAYRSRG